MRNFNSLEDPPKRIKRQASYQNTFASHIYLNMYLTEDSYLECIRSSQT